MQILLQVETLPLKAIGEYKWVRKLHFPETSFAVENSSNPIFCGCDHLKCGT